MYRQGRDGSEREIVKVELRLEYVPQRFMLSIEREDWKNDPQVHSPVRHVTGVIDMKNGQNRRTWNSRGTFICWTCLNSNGLIIILPSGEFKKPVAGFLVLCDVVSQTQAFDKSCREEFCQLGLTKAEIKLVPKMGDVSCIQDRCCRKAAETWCDHFPKCFQTLCAPRGSETAKNWCWARSNLRK